MMIFVQAAASLWMSGNMFDARNTCATVMGSSCVLLLMRASSIGSYSCASVRLVRATQ